jgi:hypothetical protein
MNPLQSSPMPLFHREAFLSNDVEVLQTDVMRFFAILCLCLMAIFALVKTLPMAPPTGRPAIVEPTDLRADAEALQKKVALLKEKLAEIMNDLDNKQRIRSALQSQVENETQHLAKIQTSLVQAREELNHRLPPEQSSAKIRPAEIPPPQSGRREFTLRFASDAALQQLIRRGTVTFYAMAGKKAWQLQLGTGQPVYLSTQFPRQIYEMQTATVPIEYTGVFQRQIAAFGLDTVTWGVTLPAQTAARINRIVEGPDGGDLVIMADGKVVLK